MGREIRRVPPNWQHPRYERGERNDRNETYKPQYDESFEEAMTDWIAEATAWVAKVQAGEVIKYHQPASEEEAAWARNNPLKAYATWEASPPDPETYRDAFTEEATAYQIYEDVSEGTPISPVLATEDELIAWMMEDHPYDEVEIAQYSGRAMRMKWHAISEAGARRFISDGSVPSFIFSPQTGLVQGEKIADLPLDEGKENLNAED